MAFRHAASHESHDIDLFDDEDNQPWANHGPGLIFNGFDTPRIYQGGRPPSPNSGFLVPGRDPILGRLQPAIIANSPHSKTTHTSTQKQKTQTSKHKTKAPNPTSTANLSSTASQVALAAESPSDAQTTQSQTATNKRQKDKELRNKRLQQWIADIRANLPKFCNPAVPLPGCETTGTDNETIAAAAYYELAPYFNGYPEFQAVWLDAINNMHMLLSRTPSQKTRITHLFSVVTHFSGQRTNVKQSTYSAYKREMARIYTFFMKELLNDSNAPQPATLHDL
ncbi:hypothetical protein HDV05_006474, partial [Chytridiales sp. JEL 0842]